MRLGFPLIPALPPVLLVVVLVVFFFFLAVLAAVVVVVVVVVAVSVVFLFLISFFLYDLHLNTYPDSPDPSPDAAAVREEE